MKTVLTPEQREMFKEEREQRIERIEQHFKVWVENER
jgi:Spy/CpxP family protein refolding chaperone